MSVEIQHQPPEGPPGLQSPGSHSTLDYHMPATPMLDSGAANGAHDVPKGADATGMHHHANGHAGMDEDPIMALFRHGNGGMPVDQQPASPGPRLRHHPYANYAVLAGEDDTDGSPGPGPTRRRVRSGRGRKASKPAGRNSRRYAGDDSGSGSEYHPEGAVEEPESDFEDEPDPEASPEPMAEPRARQTYQPQHDPNVFAIPDMPRSKGSGSQPPVQHADQPVAKEIRLTATGKPSHARKTPPGHIKRPRNAFILFRSHACVNNLIPPQLGITDHRHVSRIVGNLCGGFVSSPLVAESYSWRGLPPEEKRVWEQQAEIEKEEHRRAHPDYKYRPVYRREGVVRRRRRKALDDKEVEDEERKCEVVARVLLEGGEVSEDRVDAEVEAQRERDEAEGRVRGPASRSPSRGASMPYAYEYGQHYANGMPVDPHYEGYPHGVRYGSMPESIHLQPPHGQHPHEWQGHPGEQQWAQPQHMPRSRSHGAQPLSYDINGNPMGPEQHYHMQAPEQGQYEDPLASRRSQQAPAVLSLQQAPSPSMLGPPATPRTMAMQQHAMQLQQRIRGGGVGAGAPSPRSAAFSAIRGQPGMSSGDAMLVSPTAHAPGGQPPYQVNGSQQAGGEGADGQAGQQQSYSALGEMAAGAAVPDTSFLPLELQQDISYEPDSGVAYIYLDAEQAQDSALVERIRSQGYGVSFASAS